MRAKGIVESFMAGTSLALDFTGFLWLLVSGLDCVNTLRRSMQSWNLGGKVLLPCANFWKLLLTLRSVQLVILIFVAWNDVFLRTLNHFFVLLTLLLRRKEPDWEDKVFGCVVSLSLRKVRNIDVIWLHQFCHRFASQNMLWVRVASNRPFAGLLGLFLYKRALSWNVWIVDNLIPIKFIILFSNQGVVVPIARRVRRLFETANRSGDWLDLNHALHNSLRHLIRYRLILGKGWTSLSWRETWPDTLVQT